MRQLKYDIHAKEVKYLIQKDPRLENLFKKIDQVIVNISDDYFNSLVGTIIAQQLSGKVATVIYSRVKTYFNNEITAEKIMRSPDDDLRSLGLSYQKIKYLKSLSECLLTQKIDLNHLEQMTDEMIIEMLVKIKGIGPWSAQMFLMFSLGREDVYSVLDLGLRNGLKRFLNQPDLTNQELESISEKWKPYRSVVSHYLWHVTDQQ